MTTFFNLTKLRAKLDAKPHGVRDFNLDGLRSVQEEILQRFFGKIETFGMAGKSWKLWKLWKDGKSGKFVEQPDFQRMAKNKG